MLLLGAGSGEATCGILYLASHLRRHGVEAVVQLSARDESPAALRRSLASVLGRVRPRLVGISLKWFHHLARGLLVARLVKELDPEAEVVLGGNTASFFWRELLARAGVDHVALGDGEVPLLALAQGERSPPNVVSRGAAGGTPALRYVQGAASAEVHYSHFRELFLSEQDLQSFSGWVAPGKGCGENCLYCSGTRGLQKATFGRATPFLRPLECVQRDHREIAPHTWQLRYDFAGSTAALLESAWEGLDLSRHQATYFLWGVPPPGLAETLSRRLQRVYMVVDIGCFSEAQRLALISKGLLKPCPTDRALVELIAACRRFPNLQLEISGIAGLPFASAATLAEERALVERVLEQGCAVGYQRLESQPGALVTEHPERFGMASEARSFDDFLGFFQAQEPGDQAVPMVRFSDRKLEAAVQRTSDQVDALVWERAAKRARVQLRPTTRLRAAPAATGRFALSQWLGEHRAPGDLAREPVTVVRSIDGHGLACAPTVSPRRLLDADLQQGPDAAALLAVLEAFARPATVDAGLAELRAARRLAPASARELIEQLATARFLEPG